MCPFRSLAGLFISLLIFITGFVFDACGQTGFSIADFKSAVTARIKSTGQRDTIYKRVPNGQSCVQASDDRALEIAVLVKALQYNGRLGFLGARVGRTSGWNTLSIVPEETRKKYIGETATGSMHTYTVVELYDSNGNVHYTIDADNYLGYIYVSEHGRVNWSADHTQLIEDIPPIIRSVNIYNQPYAFVGDFVPFRVVVDAAPWVTQYLKYKWMYVGGTKILGYGDSIRFRVDYPYAYNLKAIIYHDTTGKEVVLAEVTGTTIVRSAQPVGTGRSYTSRPPVQTPAGAIPSVNAPAPAQGVFDVFKKAGDFFGR